MTSLGLRTDPITLEVLRHQLEAIGEEGANTIERTAISPVVTESKDYSCTILDREGGLLVGAGKIDYHFYAASSAVNATIATHGDSIGPGDVFLANDPHNGGGLHAQDVMVQRPVFVEGERVAWIVNSAHLMDMGGMVLGSWAPAATECFQEALRFPPVRLVNRGVEASDIFAIFRNNVRLSALVEMDLRGLVAGCHVAHEKIAALVAEIGNDSFVEAVEDMCDLTERELRRRIEALEDGVYRAVSWTEWDDEFFVVPCTLTVEGDHLHFDYEGAAPQAQHFFNSKPYIIASGLVGEICKLLAQDLPFNRGAFRPVALRCPSGTIVNSEPPAPVAAAHMDVAFNAAEVGMRALVMAVAATPGSPAAQYLSGPTGGSALATHTWSGQGLSGMPDGWAMLDGCLAGASAGNDRDGTDLGSWMVAASGSLEMIDVEVAESWYPILVEFKRARPGAFGAGTFRAGAGCNMAYSLHGTSQLFGVMLGMRERLPLVGMAGGAPGAVTEFVLHHPANGVDRIGGHASDVVLQPGQLFEFRCACGGGYGDPLDRDPGRVAVDVKRGRVGFDDARDVYGVAVDASFAVDHAITDALRVELLSRRLARAQPPAIPIASDAAVQEAHRTPQQPLYPGVVQRGCVAFSARTGAPLAVSPAHFTDGCPVLEDRRSFASGPAVVTRAYLDPGSGHVLVVDVVPDGEPRAFTTAPRRWTDAAR
ncbi:MAG TPA: hydantoinase B/oxoprolinase family protein [Acidimicrobiales bacterium]|nr:hydantoinase B/oxoprolinase family protein [Acidimicrobiales bacterium]